MPPFGTAPRRIPGEHGTFVWVTRTGRRLSPAGQHYWDTQYKLGAADGLGHYDPKVGKQIGLARSASPVVRKQAGHALGNVAQQQQHALFQPKGTFQHVLAGTLGTISPVPVDDSGP